ncbi:hypothetical protein AB835_08730 [Candidatus Endobugula sertula]|uniref:Lipoprotein n=1 Tax=Candidatus Endobugula sertula TaxID=62101 RepID=A0A1D2QPC5_9GAMM|nr:hypothetical protein AB835_08730 [Candidatus Endobugula sertula]
MKKNLILLCCVSVLGCHQGDDGLARLKALCEKDAGVTIHRTVEADGYYDAYTDCHHCWQDLIKSDYQFIEFCSEKKRNSVVYAIPNSGCYRILKKRRENNNCHVRIDKTINNKAVEPYISFKKTYCIAVEKIEKPEAQYSYDSNSKAWFYGNRISEFRRSEVYIKDNLNSEIISKYISYSYNKKPGHSSPKSCNAIEKKFPSYATAKLIQSTIHIIKEK